MKNLFLFLIYKFYNVLLLVFQLNEIFKKIKKNLFYPSHYKLKIKMKKILNFKVEILITQN
jgi:hypothetical protein